MISNSQKHFLKRIAAVLEPLRIATESEFYLQDLIGRIGWDLDEVSGFSLDQLSQHLHSFTVDFQQLVVDIEKNPPESLDDFIRTIEDVKDLYDDIRSLKAVFESPDLITTPQLRDFVTDLVEFLTIIYVRIQYPVLYHLAVLFTIIQDSAEILFSEPVFDSQGKMVRFPHRRSQLHLGRLERLLKDPVALLNEEYLGTNELKTQEDAIRASHKLFSRLDALLSELGFNTVFSYSPAYGVDFGEAGNQLAAGMLTVFLESDIEDLDFGISLAFSSVATGDLGLVVVPFGDFEYAQNLGDWNFDLGLTAGIQAFAIESQGFTLLAEPNVTAVEARLSFVKLPEFDTDVAFLVGSTVGTRLEIDQFLFSGQTTLSENEAEVDILTEVNSAVLVISPGDGDGFLQKILPPEGVRADFDLAIGWSNKKGFYFRGGAGLEASLPVQISLFGALSIDFIYLAIKTDDGGIQNIVAASIGTQIGPVQAVVDRVGLEANFTFPEDGGNLGPLHLDFGFKSPTAIGLSIDAEGITGGGFLKIDPPNYAGMMQLSFRNEIELTAFGLITTKLPDGKEGFSLVIQITAEFQPIQIGLGFALTGVGGLIGINRQMNEEGLKVAFKTHALDAILFPRNPIRDAVKIIESIQTIMPPREGYHIFGPMIQMFWGGSVRLVEFEVGIFIQLGGPLKIVIIGQARTRLPQGDSPRLVINVDVLGIIDFGEERLAIDAVLFDSRILDFTLDGKMALRADWSSGEESFALSVGGFHPRFQDIPPGFPQLTRLMVSIGSGNPRLTLQMYLAITPNTLQVGAKLDLWAKKLGFTISGGASFDALFTFSPFSFLVIINIWVSIKKSFVDLGAWLELELSGPNPIVAAGYVKFKVGWFSKKVRFRKEFGDKKLEPLPVVSPLAALQAELEHPRTIRFKLPSWASASLVFTQAAESRIDPVADILITQNAVPLNFSMQRFGGGQPPEAEQKLSITAGFDKNEEKATKALFAPEQFKNWADDERLSAKPFENYDAGIRFSGEYVIPEDAVEERPVEFEMVLRESQAYRQEPPTTWVWRPTVAESQQFVNWSLFGAGRHFKPLRQARDESQASYIKMAEPGYNLAGNETQDGKFTAVATEGQSNREMSYAEALETSKRLDEANIVIRSKADLILT